ncbi:hypothetical protein [Rufibacter psychrotolerans]|uniref:hypothetical protein n=1 Tax=Rufibacter psychrotolerans TaxID=2812556 RepID=UPI0019687D9B|nr:hypothetical protein [Rufibacter sp. SYSU D00308]
MKFTFKMFVLVGMILVGKYLKDDASNEIGKEKDLTTGSAYSVNFQETFPFTQQTNSVVEPTIKKVTTEETFTYSLN